MELAKKTKKEDGRFKIGDYITVPKAEENRGMCLIGRPQVGKSTLINSQIVQHREKGIGRHIILDTKTDFLKIHYRAGIDHLFAPMVDRRSVGWNVFSDITSPTQIPAFANGIVPDQAKDEIWPKAARFILEEAMLHCLHNGMTTNKQLYDIVTLPVTDLYNILKATPGAEQGAAVISNPETPTAFSAYFNVQAYLRPLSILAAYDGDFSIRRWIKEGMGDIFISADPDYLDAVGPLLTLFLSMILAAHMGLPEDRERRVWYVLDELAIIPPVSSLSNAMNFLPSRGAAFQLGFQNPMQLDSLFSPEVRKAIMSSIATHCFFSVGDDEAAEKSAKYIGAAEQLENRQTISTGREAGKDSGSAMDQISNRLNVTLDQIRELPALNLYCKILSFPAARVTLKYVKYPQINDIEPDPRFELKTWLANLQGEHPAPTAPPPAPAPTKPDVIVQATPIPPALPASAPAPPVPQAPVVPTPPPSAPQAQSEAHFH